MKFSPGGPFAWFAVIERDSRDARLTTSMLAVCFFLVHEDFQEEHSDKDDEGNCIRKPGNQERISGLFLILLPGFLASL